MVQASKLTDESYELDQDIYNHEDESIHQPYEDDTARERLLTEERHAYPRNLTFFQKLYKVVFRRRRRRGGAPSGLRNLISILRPTSLRRLVSVVTLFIIVLAITTALLFPSYTNRPLRYDALRILAEKSQEPGGGNPRKEKVFIAASIFDRTGDLAGGHWGRAVLQLVDYLGPSNVYLSIYENNAGSGGQQALEELESKVSCPHSLVFEEHLSLDDIPHVLLPDGSSRVKRIEYLAEVRNRALQPLRKSTTRFDKILYLNDVVFDPVEAVQLLFSTNADDHGHTDYRAACAMDFINPFKYYDTFATRDIEGYGIGLPFFPFFTTAGSGETRRQMLAGDDNVRVRSCWGGMVAFDALYFQPDAAGGSLTAGAASPANLHAPYKFRAEEDLYWDASECCLIHADIQNPEPGDSGIFLNPYVRVAYDSKTLSWLGFTRRFEKLYSPIHWIISKLIGMPWYNPRRAEKPHEQVKERVWVSESNSPYGGSFQMVERIATHSGFCGRSALQVLKSDITQGGKNWEFIPIPS